MEPEGQEPVIAAKSFQEAMVPLLELIARLSSDGEVEIVDIHGADGSNTANVMILMPIAWIGESPSPAPAKEPGPPRPG